jgi:dolichol-phosphate mannosyltransferase
MIGVVIPVYNEGEIINRTLNEIDAKIHTPHKIFVIYDMDSDDTLPVVRQRMSQQTNLVLVKNLFGKGALNAIKSGFSVVDCEAVLVVMADFSDDLSAVEPMYEMFRNGYDIICGSRYMEGGKQMGGPLLKSTMSRMAGISLHWITGIPTHDVTNSFKLYRKTTLDSIAIESNGGFELGMEIVVKAFLSGHRIGEVPTTWFDRIEGESRFRLWQWLPSYLRWYVHAVFRHFKMLIR